MTQKGKRHMQSGMNKNMHLGLLDPRLKLSWRAAVVAAGVVHGLSSPLGFMQDS